MIISSVKTVNSKKMILFRLSGLSELEVGGVGGGGGTSDFDQLLLSTKGADYTLH